MIWQTFIVILGIFLAAISTFIFLRRFRRKQHQNLHLESKISELLSLFRRFFSQERISEIQRFQLKITKDSFFSILEILLIVCWAMWITMPYADFNPEVWPRGSDFPRNVQLFSTWQNFPICGDCVLWNGTINGGAPAIADMFTPVLNPFFIISTMFWGVINGSKFLLILSFILAGLAQLWLGRVLGLSRISRLWTAAIAVAGGHLSTRMDMGHIVMVIPIAAGSLMLAAAFDVARTGRRRSVVLLALTMGLTIVSGHGYIQIAVLLGIIPSLLLFCFDNQLRWRPVWKSFLWAAVLTILITSIFWLPLIHFWPHVQKIGNPDINGGQSIGYSILNLVISDRTFLDTDILGKEPFPAMFGMYIGWVPIILVFCAFRFVPREESRTFASLLFAILLIFFVSSGTPFLWTTEFFSGFFSAARNLALIQPIAIPMVLALSGWGLDGLLRLNWPRLSIVLKNQSNGLNLAYILIIPLLWGLNSVRIYSADWILTYPVPSTDTPMNLFSTPNARWVAMPFGEFPSFPKSIEAGLKMVIHSDFTAWNWKDRTIPSPEIELTRDGNFRNDPSYTKDMGPYIVLEYPQISYAYVKTINSKIIPCDATAKGGYIDISCSTSEPGVLFVAENNFSGWQAAVNGHPVEVQGDQMQIALSEGASSIQLRYRPWDVRIGGILSAFGLIMCAVLWFRPLKHLPEEVPLEELNR